MSRREKRGNQQKREREKDREENDEIQKRKIWKDNEEREWVKRKNRGGGIILLIHIRYGEVFQAEMQFRENPQVGVFS